MKRRTKFVLSISFVGIAGVASMALSRASEPFPAKYRVLNSIIWDTEPLSDNRVEANNYRWLDNETLVFAEIQNKRQFTAMRQRVSAGKQFSAKPLGQVNPIKFPILVSVSPHRKWLVAMETPWGDNVRYFFHALDGSKRIKEYVLAYNEPHWLSEGNSFIASLPNSKDWWRISLSDGTKKRLTFKHSQEIPPYFAVTGEYFSTNNHWGETKPLRLKRGSYRTKKTHTYFVDRVGIPVNSILYAVSPQGDKLLWYSEETETSRRANRTDAIDWFITDPNGRNRRRFALLTAEHQEDVTNAADEIFPRWLPDSRHISVIYKNALYVVPVR